MTSGRRAVKLREQFDRNHAGEMIAIIVSAKMIAIIFGAQGGVSRNYFVCSA
jgi:hypothetical protein